MTRKKAPNRADRPDPTAYEYCVWSDDDESWWGSELSLVAATNTAKSIVENGEVEVAEVFLKVAEVARPPEPEAEVTYTEIAQQLLVLPS